MHINDDQGCHAPADIKSTYVLDLLECNDDFSKKKFFTCE